jgi:hypothetical protein
MFEEWTRTILREEKLLADAGAMSPDGKWETVLRLGILATQLGLTEDTLVPVTRSAFKHGWGPEGD